MILGESQCIPHPFIPPLSPDSVRSGEAKSEDSKSSMVITRLGSPGWLKTGGDQEISKRKLRVGSREGEEREKVRKEVRSGKEDANKGVQAMTRHARRQSGHMDSRPSHDSTGQVNTSILIIKC